MKFWIDAQLPPALATWLSRRFAVDAVSLRDLGLRDAADIDIFRSAQQHQLVLISKDCDFVDLVSRYGPPPQLIWVTCGNVTNARLQDVFSKTFAEATASLSSGQAIVEIS